MIKALWHTSKTRSDYLPITISVMSWMMAFIQGRWIFKPSIKDVFHNHWKVMKIYTLCVKILCRNREDLCSCFWTYFFNVEDCVAASVNISTFFNERAAASEKISMCDCFWRKCAADIFCVCGCFWKHFIVFLRNGQLLLKSIIDCFWKKKMCSCVLKLSPLKKYFEAKIYSVVQF